MQGALNEDVREELEVLAAIYMEDYLERPPVWNFPSFAIKMYSSNSNQGQQIKITVRFKLSATYPRTAVKVEIENSVGLSAEELKELNTVIEQTAKNNLNAVMCHEICLEIQSFIDKKSYVQESFYDAMMRREQEKTTFIENLKKDSTAANVVVPTASVPETTPTEKKQAMDGYEFSKKFLMTQQSKAKEEVKKNVLPKTGEHNTAANDISNKINATAQALSILRPKMMDQDDEDGLEETDEKRSSSPLYYDNSKSRYSQEFMEMFQIGNGASGEVWKVRHKLDRRIYAVKKIDLNSRNNAVGSKIQREVTTISRLIHKNIVRYYAAWIEQYEATTKPRARTMSRDKPGITPSSSGNQPTSGSSVWINSNSLMREAELQAALGSRQNYDDLNISFGEDGSYSDFGNNKSNSNNVGLSGFGIKRTIRTLSSYQYSSSSRGGGADSSEDSDDYDSSDEDDSDDSDEDASFDEDTSSSGGDSVQHKVARWMFIQMEYCYSTLHALIEEKNLYKDTQEIIRLLRQMLEALAYMHNAKVIHRDLKPANIFLDGEGDIKVGDFGLATSGNSKKSQEKTTSKSDLAGMDNRSEVSATLNNDLSTQSGMQEVLEGLTAGIGTALYRAPEQELSIKAMDEHADPNREYHVPYNEKADMYSLGIILFEMCVKPFGTKMERFHVITALREKHEFPADFTSYVPENIVKIITWLTETNPKKRPAALELLNSDLMPARADTDMQYFNEFKDALRKPGSSALQNVLQLFFDEERSSNMVSKKTKDSLTSAADLIYNRLNFDIDAFQKTLNLLNPRILVNEKQPASTLSLVRDQTVLSLHYLNAIKRKLRHVFETRGGVDFAGQIMELRGSIDFTDHDRIAKLDSNAVELLDRSGQVVYLQNDLVTSYARLVAFLNIFSAQRYLIDKVYLTNASKMNLAIGTQPRAVDEAVYDIIVPANQVSQSILADTEILGASLEIMKSLQNVIAPTALRIYHNLIFEGILLYCCWEGESSGHKEIVVSDEIRYKAAKLFTAATDAPRNMKEFQSVITSASLPVHVANKLQSFLSILINQDITSPTHDPLKVLNNLQNKFFGAKEILSMNKDTSIIDHVAKMNISGLMSTDLSKQQSSKTAPSSAANSTATAASSKATSSTSADGGKAGSSSNNNKYVPITIDHIGEKRSQAPGKKAEPAPAIKKDSATDQHLPTKRERGSSLGISSAYDALKPSFEAFKQGVSYLKQVLITLALQQTFQESMINDLTLSQQVLSEQSLDFLGSNIIIDLGMEAIHFPRHVNFHQDKGVRFVVETYLSISNGTQTDTQATSTQSSAATLQMSPIPSNAPINAATKETSGKSQRRGSGTTLNVEESIVAANNSNNIAADFKERRRFKKSGGIIIAGGHFESRVYEYSKQFQAIGWPDGFHVYACGLRVFIDNLMNQIHRFEKQKEFVQSMDRPQTVFNKTERIIALVVTGSTLSHEVELNPSYYPNPVTTSIVVNWLRHNNIRSTAYLHQLQGYHSGKAQKLCEDLNIPILITVESESCNEVFVQIIGESLSMQNECTLPLADVPKWIKSRISPDYYLHDQIISPLMDDHSLFTSKLATPLPTQLTSTSTTTTTTESTDDNKIFATNVVTAMSLTDDIFTNRKKKRELDMLILKLTASLSSATNILVDKVLIRSVPEVTGKAKIQGYVIAMETPLSVLRNFNTLLLTKSSSTSFKTDYDAFLGADAMISHRKMLKNALSYLISLATNILAAMKQNESKANTTGSKGQQTNKSTGASTSIPTPQSNNNANQYRQVLYTYSIIDDQIDMVHLNIESIANLRGI